MSPLRFVPADQVAPAELHGAFAAAFADYLTGPLQAGLPQWPQFIGRQVADLSRSRVAFSDGAIAAFALVAPRPDRACWRLATMGAVPRAPGGGAAQALLDDFVARAADAGRREVELECFAQNERAMRLYRSRGFRPLHALHGYEAAAASIATAMPAMAVHAVPLGEAFAWLDHVAREHADLPLQVTPPSLQAQTVVLQAWRCGPAQLVAGESAPGRLSFYSLVDLDAGQAGAQALAVQAAQLHPAHQLHVPQLQREDLGGAALLRLGFDRLPLFQQLLRRPLQDL